MAYIDEAQAARHRFRPIVSEHVLVLEMDRPLRMARVGGTRRAPRLFGILTTAGNVSRGGEAGSLYSFPPKRETFFSWASVLFLKLKFAVCFPPSPGGTNVACPADACCPISPHVNGAPAVIYR